MVAMKATLRESRSSLAMTSLVLPAGCQGLLQFRPVVAPASLDLGVLGQQDAADAREVAHYGRTLGLKAEAGPVITSSRLWRQVLMRRQNRHCRTQLYIAVA
jgi:hypothetical protein